MTRQERCAEANRVIAAVAAFGRRFFYNQRTNDTARFELDERGRIWWWDEQSHQCVYVHYRGRWKHFTHGGTMRALVDGLAQYILRGTRLPAGHFGPWASDYIPDGDLWGYGAAEMAKVREAVGVTDAVSKPYCQAEPAGVVHAE